MIHERRVDARVDDVRGDIGSPVKRKYHVTDSGNDSIGMSVFLIISPSLPDSCTVQVVFKFFFKKESIESHNAILSKYKTKRTCY